MLGSIDKYADVRFTVAVEVIIDFDGKRLKQKMFHK